MQDFLGVDRKRRGDGFVCRQYDRDMQGSHGVRLIDRKDGFVVE